MSFTATSPGLDDEPCNPSFKSDKSTYGDTARLVQRELLDHVIVLNEHHLRRLLDSYVDHYNQDRTHLGLSKDSPLGRPVEHRPAGSTSKDVSLPRVGGLHHRYTWRQAA